VGSQRISLNELNGFYIACIALAQAIERFPHRVLVM
jgi:hypothetical protein